MLEAYLPDSLAAEPPTPPASGSAAIRYLRSCRAEAVHRRPDTDDPLRSTQRRCLLRAEAQ
jgi:hypothetical protein